jgi:hypothetical protein
MSTFTDIADAFRRLEKHYFKQTTGYNGRDYDKILLIGNSIEITIDSGKMIIEECEALPTEKLVKLNSALASFHFGTEWVGYDTRHCFLIVHLVNDRKTLALLNKALGSAEEADATTQLMGCYKKVRDNMVDAVGRKKADKIALRAARNVTKQIKAGPAQG